MKMRDHKIGAAELPVERRGTQHDSRKASDQELEQKANAEKHRSPEVNLSAPHRPQPIEDLNSCGNTNGHRGDGEEAVCVGIHPGCEHVMSPNTKAHETDADRRRHHHRIPEYRLSGKNKENFRQESERGNNKDVHLWSSENQEEGHPKNGRPSSLRVKEVPAEITVNAYNRLSCGERRYGKNTH